MQHPGESAALMEIAVYDELTRGILADIAALRQECETLRKDAERYRKLRESGSALKLYVYEDKADPFSGDWHYKPGPEDVDAFADGLGAA